MAQVGQIIDGKYEILKEVGKGGMSRVYLAMDQRLNKQWAVKEIQKRGRDENNEYVIQSAIAEANLIKSLDHPSIVRITDIIENEDVIYIVEDYIEGETLASILRREGAQPQERVIEWAIQLCEALQYLHSRKPAIIYRDIINGTRELMSSVMDNRLNNSMKYLTSITEIGIGFMNGTQGDTTWMFSNIDISPLA